ncbi:MAG TPA: hypothetical protein DCZ13_11650 [Porticoccaceae bacterium]|nr:hypothetical protein [Porticoccaceae bacterium]
MRRGATVRTVPSILTLRLSVRIPSCTVIGSLLSSHWVITSISRTGSYLLSNKRTPRRWVLPSRSTRLSIINARSSP